MPDFIDRAEFGHVALDVVRADAKYRKGPALRVRWRKRRPIGEALQPERDENPLKYPPAGNAP